MTAALRLPRHRQASLPVVVLVFAGVFAGLLGLAFVGGGTDGAGDDVAEERRALLSYEAAIEAAAQEAGAAIVLGIRPDITDFRAGRISAEVFRNDMSARARQFESAAAALRRASVPKGLEPAAALFARAFERYRVAVAVLYEAGAVDGPEREVLIERGASTGDDGDELYDRAMERVQEARRALGLEGDRT